MIVITAKGHRGLELQWVLVRYSQMDEEACETIFCQLYDAKKFVSTGVVVEFNRNQFFFLGAVILFIGLQVRMVSAYVLNEEATRFLAERTYSSASAPEQALVSFTSDTGLLPNKVIRPPQWLGWCLISVGGVLMLHSLAMPRPGY